MSSPLLEVKDLQVTVGEEQKVLLDGLNLTIYPGETHVLMGHNGAGKSTFLKILSGQLDTTKGDIVITPGQRLSVLEQDHFKYDAYQVLDTVIM